MNLSKTLNPQKEVCQCVCVGGLGVGVSGGIPYVVGFHVKKKCRNANSLSPKKKKETKKKA